jgi:hypothetical protein
MITIFEEYLEFDVNQAFVAYSINMLIRSLCKYKKRKTSYMCDKYDIISRVNLKVINN